MVRYAENQTGSGFRPEKSDRVWFFGSTAPPRQGDRMRLKVFLTTTVCLALLAGVAGAQVPTGTISGRVLDQDGGGVPGATITVASPNLQGERVVVSSMYGDYSIPLLPPGDYTVRVELSGFQTVTKQVAVAATQTVSLDLSLAL